MKRRIEITCKDSRGVETIAIEISGGKTFTFTRDQIFRLLSDLNSLAYVQHVRSFNVPETSKE